VTAASSSGISDGAAALVLTRESFAAAHGIKPLARILGYTSFAREPEWFTLAPVGAIQKLLKQLNWQPKDVDLYEINEAFAAVAMAAIHDLDLDHQKVNAASRACASAAVKRRRSRSNCYEPGIIPAVISPFVLGKIGEHAARRYFLTAETMTGGTLLAVALAHEGVPAASLEAGCARLSQALLQGEPLALAQATSLIRDMARSSPSERAAKSAGRRRAWRDYASKRRPKRAFVRSSASANSVG
jgi:hypothetical protein